MGRVGGVSIHTCIALDNPPNGTPVDVALVGVVNNGEGVDGAVAVADVIDDDDDVLFVDIVSLIAR
jgi:hypothetical protein